MKRIHQIKNSVPLDQANFIMIMIVSTIDEGFGF